MRAARTSTFSPRERSGRDARATIRTAAGVMLALALLVTSARGQVPQSEPERDPQPLPRPFPSPAPPSIEPEKDPARAFLFPLRVEWSANLPDVPVSWPSFDAEHAYVPTRSGELFAISLDDGTIVWCAEGGTVLPPVVGERTIFVAVDTAIHALETTIGDRRWRVPTGAPFSAPLLHDTGWLVACLEGGQVMTLRGDTGETLWRRDLGATCRARPAIAGPTLYVPLEDGRVRALELTSGEPRWEAQLGGEVTELLPLGQHVYAGSRDNFFYALAGNSGRVLWRWRTGADIIGEPVVDRNRIYFGSLDNVYRAVDRNHGAQRWKQPLPMRPQWGARMLDDIVVISGMGPEIRGYRAEDGEAAGFFIAPSELIAPPHVADGETADQRRVYVLTDDGTLMSLLHRVDPLIEPLVALPGTTFPPFTPMGVLPGLRVGVPRWAPAERYLPGAVGLPPAVAPAEIHGRAIGHPPAPNDVPGVTIGFPPAPAPPELPGTPLPFPPAPYWFEPWGIALGFPPVPDTLRLPGIQLSLPPPPVDPLPIELPGRVLPLPPEPPDAEEPADGTGAASPPGEAGSDAPPPVAPPPPAGAA